MTGRNPRTRGARFPFVLQFKDERGRWGDVGGRNTYQEAVDWALATAPATAKHLRRLVSYRVRAGRKTVFELELSYPTAGATILTITGTT